jgi:hypothetical protein
LLNLHRDYLGGLAGKIPDIGPPPPSDRAHTVDEWLVLIHQLYEPEQIPALDTRLTLYGLTILEPGIKKLFEQADALRPLEREIEKDIGKPPVQLLRDPNRPAVPEEQPTEAEDDSSESAEETPAPADNPYLPLAAAYAAAANRPEIDSVLFLAAILAQEAPANADSEANALLLAIATEGETYNSIPDQIIRRLKLDEIYSLPSLPTSAADTYTLNPTAELSAALGAAAQIADQTAPDGAGGARHYLAPLLHPTLSSPRPQAYDHWRKIGVSAAALRQALLANIREYRPEDNLEQWRQLLTKHEPPAPGYISDYVPAGMELKDQLEITHEVTTIAHVLLARRVQPPLALGLFGDWGSGKSFFMSQLQRTIKTHADHYRAEEREQGQSTPWCSRVLQIDFNAWNYADTNLWASLVTRIYDGLQEELSDKTEDKDRREKLDEKIMQAEGVVKNAEEEVNKAKSRVTQAEEAFTEAQAERQKEQNKLRDLIDNVVSLLSGKSQTNESLAKAADALGYPEAKQSYTALVELNSNLKSFSGRLAALAVNILQAPWPLVLLAFIILLLPLAVNLVMQQAFDWIDATGRNVAEVSAFLIGLITWLKIQVDRGLKLVGDVEEALKEAEAVRQKRLSEDKDTQKAQQALSLAQAREQAARENLRDAQGELQRLQTEMAELRPERKLYRLIEERARTAAYSQYLGIISLIRADFEKISVWMEEMIAEERDLSEEDPPIQRIILYIDDLDRCRPERVVEVLEAVHLLLAFPLFIVVVGVDPRWLRHALAHHYAQTLSENGPVAGENGQQPATTLDGGAAYATPQDYLEKIFQIPFALRPVNRQGYRNLIGNLLQPLPEPARRTKPAGSPPADDEAQPVSTPPEVPPPTIAGPPAPADDDTPPTEPAPVDPTQSALDASEVEPEKEKIPFVPLSAEQLDFQPWEEEDLYRLWPLFRTPRSIKRFVNIYRLVRASLATADDVAKFEGSAAEPCEYQTVLLLLAVVTAFPNQANEFLQHVRYWLDAQPLTNNKFNKWPDFLATLPQTAPATRPVAASPPPGVTTVTGVSGPDTTDAEWQRLIICLNQITAEQFTQPFTRETLSYWSQRITRYAFTI